LERDLVLVGNLKGLCKRRATTGVTIVKDKEYELQQEIYWETRKPGWWESGRMREWENGNYKTLKQ